MNNYDNNAAAGPLPSDEHKSKDLKALEKQYNLDPKTDYYIELISKGFTVSDLEYARPLANKNSLPYDAFLASMYLQLKNGQTVEEVKAENGFPSFYGEDRGGELVRGKYTFENLREECPSFQTTDLVEAVKYIYSDNYTLQQRAEAEALILARATELRQTTAIRNVIKAYNTGYKKEHTEIAEYPVSSELLKFDKDGELKPTIENFRIIMENDPFYNGGEPLYQKVFFNVVANRAEIHTFTATGELLKTRTWEDADFSASMEHIESVYSLYSKEKHDSALFSFWKSREYNPVTIRLDALRGKWDGVERCSDFLTVWGKASNDEYTRAVSRMIFDGAVARAYMPGIKFDEVAVLTGEQGSGKSTLCTFLAMYDLFHGTISTFAQKEQTNLEKLEGKWIVELEELITRKDLEFQGRLKAFTSSRIDTYRKPYGKGVSDLPRRCIFIGTTNHEDFLSDLTGNRRFYPVAVRCNARAIYKREQECRDYIEKCYAEAVNHYDKKQLMTTFPEELLDEAKARQADAMQPNFVFDAVMEFLDKKKIGDTFTIRQILHEELNLTPKDILADKKIEQTVATILNSCEWVDKGKRKWDKGKTARLTIYEKTNPNLPPIE